jgi:hypothetical protein
VVVFDQRAFGRRVDAAFHNRQAELFHPNWPSLKFRLPTVWGARCAVPRRTGSGRSGNGEGAFGTLPTRGGCQLRAGVLLAAVYMLVTTSCLAAVRPGLKPARHWKAAHASSTRLLARSSMRSKNRGRVHRLGVSGWSAHCLMARCPASRPGALSQLPH